MGDPNAMCAIDVYDIVTDFAKEFRPIIHLYGAEPFSNIMGKVVTILEHLETQAMTIGKLNSMLEEREAIIIKLEKDKAEREAGRQRFEKELEQIEEHWRNETHELITMVNRLQEDNKKLTRSIAKQDNSLELNSKQYSTDFDTTALHKSHVCIDKLREQIKIKERDIISKNLEIENLTDQVNRLINCSKELRKKLKTSQSQVTSLIDESAEIMTHYQEGQRELITLKQNLGVARKENQDLIQHKDETPDLRNKAVYDLDDPNRPRFTVDELKELLRERNEYKALISELEEELLKYRPKKPTLPEEEFVEDDEAPVQGPLPYEPTDAPWRRSESGIRKLFKKLFSESNLTFLSSSPKHVTSLQNKVIP